MKKTLTAIALFAALATNATTAEARVVSRTIQNPLVGSTLPAHASHNEGLQNYYYYFGAPCCNKPMALAAAPCAAPCATPAPACAECAPCSAPVEYEQVCTTCNPCGSSFNILNPFTYFG